MTTFIRVQQHEPQSWECLGDWFKSYPAAMGYARRMAKQRQGVILVYDSGGTLVNEVSYENLPTRDKLGV